MILGSEATPKLSYEQIGASGESALKVMNDARDATRVRASLGVVIAAKSIESEDLVTS
jgi:hypothetical protein